MDYQIRASSIANQDAEVQIKQSTIEFGTTQETTQSLPNPAELFLGSFAACILKSVERFSKFMKFSYTHADLTVQAVRLEGPPRMDNISYDLIVYSDDASLNTVLLQKNIEKFGTIYNTVNMSCTISGSVSTKANV